MAGGADVKKAEIKWFEWQARLQPTTELSCLFSGIEYYFLLKDLTSLLLELFK